MILRPVSPQSPSGPPITKLPVGLTRKSDGLLGIQPFGSADSTAPAIMSLTMPGVYFLALRLCALAFGVGLQVEQLAGTALVGQYLQNFVREIDRRRHERILFVDFALGAGET